MEPEQNSTTATPKALTLHGAKLGTFLARHPWVLDRSLQIPTEPIEVGETVDLVSAGGRFVARGIYNPVSRIRVRLYSWNPEVALDDSFFATRLAAALDLRRQLDLLGQPSAARLVFSEGDYLSGLIVDKFGGHLVVQLTAKAMELRLPWILERLVQALAPQSISIRIDPKVAAAEGLTSTDQCVYGTPPSEPVVIEQHGVRFRIDFGGAQKTGYYLDQRDNRRIAAAWANGRDVLDVCCYTGGFALTLAALGQPTRVVGVDSSERAVVQARENAAENGLSAVEFEVADCFDYLERCCTTQRKFGMVVLDPPKFAGNRRALSSGMRAYHRLNRLAVECVEPGGILVTCSCSGLVSREDFRHILSGVSQKTGRGLQVLEQRGAAPDHPVSISCPETDYLKCFVCRVG